MHTFPVSLTFQNPCTGEAVTVAGVVHAVGGDHFRYTASGVSASGATYLIRSVDNEVGGRGQGASVSTTAATMYFVREGGSGNDDFMVHGVTHTTINATGEMTADFGMVDGQCI